MSQCEKLEKCGFFNEYKEKRALNSILEKFIQQYCLGDKKDECVRKKISLKYGPEKVPVNMTPTGIPVLGTSRDGWSQEALNPPK
jgi:hypothetical protein